MDRISYKEELEVLCQAGLTRGEIERLVQFRQRLTKSEQEQADIDFSRLQFIRWLVEHGKLSEQLD